MQIDVLYILIVLTVIFFSMTLHEVMHGFAAYWLGDDTAAKEGRLTFNPIKHIDPFLTIALPLILAVIGAPIFGGAKPVPFNPFKLRYDDWGAALVAFAGPLTNFVIAFILFASFALSKVETSTFAGQFLIVGVYVNLGFFVFNMIPVPPLDGSRVLYALAPEFVRRGMEAIERFGLIFIFALVMIASPLIGIIISAGTGAIVRWFGLLFGITVA